MPCRTEMFNVSAQIRRCYAVTGCRVWTREANRAARNGVFYGWTSQSDCMTACLTSASCVAIDVGHVGCVLHNNIEDLSDAYNASGVTQFLLHRDCLPPITRPATTVTTFTTSTGKINSKMTNLADLLISEHINLALLSVMQET